MSRSRLARRNDFRATTESCWLERRARVESARTSDASDPQSYHKYLYGKGDPIQHVDPTGMFSVTEINVSAAINQVMAGMRQAIVYTAKPAVYAGIETALEMTIGNMIGSVTGVAFNLSDEEITRTFSTNLVSNLATSHLCHARVLRKVLDITRRYVSDVEIGGQDPVWASAINLASLAGSEILSKYAGQILGKAFEKYGCFVAGTPVVTGFDGDPSVDWIRDGDGLITTARRTTTLAIESIPLGSRVITESPEEHFDEDGFGAPNQSTWRKVMMLHHRRDDTVTEMELLRTTEWLIQAGIEAGRVIDLRFAEHQTAGYASVLSVSHCPPIEEGAGRVVIGRFVSRGVGTLLRVTLEDGSEFTGTANHPVWSVDAGDWRRIDKFQVGEQMFALDGPVAIAWITPVPRSANV